MKSLGQSVLLPSTECAPGRSISCSYQSGGWGGAGDSGRGWGRGWRPGDPGRGLGRRELETQVEAGGGIWRLRWRLGGEVETQVKAGAGDPWGGWAPDLKS